MSEIDFLDIFEIQKSEGAYNREGASELNGSDLKAAKEEARQVP